MWHCLGLNSEPFMPMSKPPRFFTPLRSVQNDIIIHCLLTVTSYKRADTRVRPYGWARHAVIKRSGRYG